MNWVNREYWAARARLPRAYTLLIADGWHTLISPASSTHEEKLEVFNKMQRRNGETQ
jgi:hypothetical protein